jgi:hypothetical protein
MMLTLLVKNNNLRFHKNDNVKVNQNSLTLQPKSKGLRIGRVVT